MPGIGGSFSRSESQSSSQGSTFVEEAQAPFLDFLRNAGLDAFGGFQDMAAIFGQQSQGLAGQSANLQQNPFLAQLFGQAGGNQQLVQQQSDALSADLGKFFNEQLVPGVNQGGQQTGQFGGSRGDIGRGIAAQGVTDQLQRGILGFQSADAQRALQAGQAGGQLFNQFQGQQLQGFGQAANILGQGFGAQFDPLFALQQIFGGPNNLSQQSSQSTASSMSVGLSGG